MHDEIDRGLEATKQRMAARVQQLLACLPEDLKAREDQMPIRIRAENASAKVKLVHIYKFMDEFSEQRAPFVACRQGCASCCRMNVQISNLEAARIVIGTGRRARPVSSSIKRADTHFAGQPCSFLIEDACSIYDHRPYVCRNHVSFDVDAYWCDTSRMGEAALPQLELGGVKDAMLDVIASTSRPVLADIRDFFPSSP